jgi:hypothetical protein
MKTDSMNNFGILEQNPSRRGNILSAMYQVPSASRTKSEAYLNEGSLALHLTSYRLLRTWPGNCQLRDTCLVQRCPADKIAIATALNFSSTDPLLLLKLTS